MCDDAGDPNFRAAPEFPKRRSRMSLQAVEPAPKERQRVAPQRQPHSPIVRDDVFPFTRRRERQGPFTSRIAGKSSRQALNPERAPIRNAPMSRECCKRPSPRQ